MLHYWQDDHATDTPKQYAAMVAVQGPMVRTAMFAICQDSRCNMKLCNKFCCSVLAWHCPSVTLNATAVSKDKCRKWRRPQLHQRSIIAGAYAIRKDNWVPLRDRAALVQDDTRFCDSPGGRLRCWAQTSRSPDSYHSPEEL